VFGRFCREKRGASVITYALTLPLFVLLVFGILEVWRVMAVRQSLNLGVYQAMRYLSSQGRDWLPSSAGAWETIACRTAAQCTRSRELNPTSEGGHRTQCSCELG